MVFMTYANVVFSYGTERFVKKAAEVGMDGLILPDVPFEEKEEFDGVCKEYGLDLISLIAPTSHERISMIAKEAQGLDALVEAHDEREVERALEAGAKIVGVNNRDLRTFRVDMNNSIRLRNLAPEEVVFVSESGIRTSADINLLYDNRVDAVLIGETLMRSPDKKAMLETLNGKPLSW